MQYSVFCICYQGANYVNAVAVSGSSKRAAIARLQGHRSAEIVRVEKIGGRAPQYAQDRIEGTCDLRDLLRPPPEAGTKEAAEIRQSNAKLIAAMLAAAPQHKGDEG